MINEPQRLIRRFCCFILLSFATIAPIRGREIRATWFTTTGNDHLSSKHNIQQRFAQAAAEGINTVYVEAWKNGFTQFHSPTMNKTIGIAINPALGGRDLMQEALEAARECNLTMIAWMEYGLIAAFKDTQNELRKQYPQWLSRDAKGSEVAENGFVWLNPLRDEVYALVEGIAIDLLQGYDVDGIQWDDHLCWPYYNMVRRAVCEHLGGAHCCFR